MKKLFKVYKAVILRLCGFWSTCYTRAVFILNGIECKGARSLGRVKVNVSLGGKAKIGKAFYIRTGAFNTEVGQVGSRLLVGSQGVLAIGDHVGMSNATIVADCSVTIGNHVHIGGGVQIFDTNFHSIDADVRASGKETREDVLKAPIVIGDNAFIGTNSIICKGVTIGEGAIVAAGSVVVKDVPPKTIFGGNPAQRIR